MGAVGQRTRSRHGATECVFLSVNHLCSRKAISSEGIWWGSPSVFLSVNYIRSRKAISSEGIWGDRGGGSVHPVEARAERPRLHEAHHVQIAVYYARRRGVCMAPLLIGSSM